MRICLVCPYPFNRKGGVQEHVLNLASCLLERGHEPMILCASPGKPTGPMGKYAFAIGRGFPVHANSSRASSNISVRPLQIPRFLKNRKPDIVHLHNMDVGLWSWTIARNAKKLGIPVFLTWHGTLDASKFARVLPFILFRALYRSTFTGAIAVSDTALESLRLFSGPTRIIPNGINLTTFDSAKTEAKFVSPDAKTLLFVGRLEKRKGILELIHAFKLLCVQRNDVRLVIIGEGPLRREAERLVRRYGLHERVVFEGSVSGELLPSYYASADVVCAPSLYGESFGLVLFEAWAMGRPVLIGDNRGYRGVVGMRNGEDFDAQSLLVDPRDFEASARQLNRLLIDNSYREQAVQWGLALARDPRFQWMSVTEQILKFYADVLGS